MALPRSFGRILALALILGVTSLVAAAPQSQGPTVSISLSGNSIQVSPSRVEVTRGQRVTWTGSVPFAIVVNEQGTVFPGVPAQAMRGLANRPLNARVGGNAPNRTYKYSVVVWDGSELRVRDPEIVVKPN
jgi:hypothetical protein